MTDICIDRIQQAALKNIAPFLALIFMIIPYGGVQAQSAQYDFVSIRSLIEQEVGALLIPVIYEKLDYKATITPMPGSRAQEEATSGAKDGEIMRIFTYGQNNPTTIRVPEPYYYLETMGFVLSNSSIEIKTKEDLRPYRLAKVRGVKHTDNITAGMDNVYNLKDTPTMMEFLRRGRADIALTNTVDGNLVLQQLGYKNIKPIDKPLAVLDLFNYIHEDHKEIVSQVDTVIKAMKKSGELDALIKKAEDQVIANRQKN